MCVVGMADLSGDRSPVCAGHGRLRHGKARPACVHHGPGTGMHEAAVHRVIHSRDILPQVGLREDRRGYSGCVHLPGLESATHGLQRHRRRHGGRGRIQAWIRMQDVVIVLRFRPRHEVQTADVIAGAEMIYRPAAVTPRLRHRGVLDVGG